MLNINELENRWLRYKIKAYIPHAVIVLSLIVIFTVIALITGSKTDETAADKTQVQKIKKVEQQPVLVKNSKEKSINDTEQESLKKEPVHKQEMPKEKKPELNKVVISPSLNFMQEIEEETKNKTVKKPLPKKTPKKVETKKKSEPKPVLKEERQTIVIDIGKEDTQKEIEDVIRRFKKTNSPVLSLFVAKKYYEAGNYTMAYNYALITNGIDSEIEPSWLIFAKSLVKLNKKDKAIKTLKEYIAHSHSSRAQTLLDEIVSGKMK